MPNLNPTATEIRPSLLPNTPAPDATEFNLAGFKVQAADLGDIHRATFEMKIPLNPGEYKVPGDFRDIELDIQSGTTANIQLEVNQNSEGKSIITQGEVNLTRELIIKNPASSLEPTGDGEGFNGFLDDIKDAAADLKIQKVFMSKNGDIHVVGKIDMPWPIPDERIDRIEATIDPDIEKSSIVLPELKELGPLLAKAGAITGRASYDAYVETTPRVLGVEHPSIHLTSNRQPITLSAEGEAEITSDGTILLNLQESNDPSVHSGPATLSATGFAEINVDAREGWIGDGELAFRGDIHNIRGSVEPTDGLRIPMNFTGDDRLSFRGRTGVSLRGDRFRLTNGVFHSNLRDEVESGSHLSHAGRTARLGHGSLNANAQGRFNLDENGVKIFDTTVAAGIQGGDASFTLDGYRTELAGLIESKLNASDVELSSHDFSISGRGGVFYRIDPRTSDLRENHDLNLFERNIDFSLNPDGKLTVRPGEHGAAEFFAPFLRVSGNPERLVSKHTAAVGRVESSALLKHIENVSEAKTSHGNKVELLIDGAMSYPKRLEMIRSAQESICLQTLIFKDDESGLETAKELVEAVQRGVDVRVIIDTLGNVENFDHIVNDRKLYRVLREGGVQLELYNDPRDSGLGELVNAIHLVPSLSEIKSPNDLNNPEIALKVVMELVSVANGKVSVEQSIREKVEQALNLFSTTESDEKALIRLPSGRIINAAQAALMAKLIAEMNHRWHEKYLIVDGQKAILGGLNIADEYMFGGTGRRFETMGAEREAWRDTDVYIEGPSARDAFDGFSKNWEHIRGERLPQPSQPPRVFDDERGTTLQFIQHHPRLAGDHNITNFMVETIKALEPGEKAYIANSTSSQPAH